MPHPIGGQYTPPAPPPPHDALWLLEAWKRERDAGNRLLADAWLKQLKRLATRPGMSDAIPGDDYYESRPIARPAGDGRHVSYARD